MSTVHGIRPDQHINDDQTQGKQSAQGHEQEFNHASAEGNVQKSNQKHLRQEQATQRQQEQRQLDRQRQPQQQRRLDTSPNRTQQRQKPGASQQSAKNKKDPRRELAGEGDKSDTELDTAVTRHDGSPGGQGQGQGHEGSEQGDRDQSHGAQERPSDVVGQTSGNVIDFAAARGLAVSKPEGEKAPETADSIKREVPQSSKDMQSWSRRQYSTKDLNTYLRDQHNENSIVGHNSGIDNLGSEGANSIAKITKELTGYHEATARPATPYEGGFKRDLFHDPVDGGRPPSPISDALKAFGSRPDSKKAFSKPPGATSFEGASWYNKMSEFGRNQIDPDYDNVIKQYNSRPHHDTGPHVAQNSPMHAGSHAHNDRDNRSNFADTLMQLQSAMPPPSLPSGSDNTSVSTK